MDFRETIEEVHTVAFGAGGRDQVFVLTDDGWRCYHSTYTDVPAL